MRSGVASSISINRRFARSSATRAATAIASRRSCSASSTANPFSSRRRPQLMKNPLLKSQARRADETLSRRRVLGGIGAAALLPFVPELICAQDASAQLPLKTTGLEHMGTVVPDVEAAAKFYGRLFNPELHKEKDPPLRYYVTLGVGYLAFGSRANEPRTFFDHFCALVQDYNAPAMAEELKSKGLPAGKYGIIPDPDAIGLQLLAA